MRAANLDVRASVLSSVRCGGQGGLNLGLQASVSSSVKWADDDPAHKYSTRINEMVCDAGSAVPGISRPPGLLHNPPYRFALIFSWFLRNGLQPVLIMWAPALMIQLRISTVAFPCAASR